MKKFTTHSVVCAGALLAACCLFAAGCRHLARYNLLNPQINFYRKARLLPARKDITDLLQKQKDEGRADHISVYFQALDTGYSVGIEEQEGFIPASLMKLYLAMSILRTAEKEPGSLEVKVVYNNLEGEAPAGSLPMQEIPAAEKLRIGETYTIDRLLTQMLVFSDNNATYNLRARYSKAALERTYRVFGLRVPESGEFHITVKQYMMIFLSLYNSTYLTPEMSQKILGHLLRTRFRAGLAAGLPPGVRLANKFGERKIIWPSGTTMQLHDCGVIYHGKSPYILGVMTRGRDPEKLAGVISEISALVYKEVSRQP